MYKTYKFRMYPNNEQRILINKTFGCTRFIYNYYLEKCKKEGYKNAKTLCKDIKFLCNEFNFLREVDSNSLRNAVFNLEDSYKNFFSKRSNYPCFKNKYKKQSFRTSCIRSVYKGKEYSNIDIDMINKRIKLPKLSYVNIRGYRNLNILKGRIINATIEKELTNKYYVCVVIDEEEINVEKVKPKNIVGIDLGIKDLIVTSNAEKYKNPKEINKYEKRIKMMQKKLSKKERGSNNYNKTKIRLARLYEKLKNARKYNIIKIVNKIVKEHDIIISEKLSIKKMHNNHTLTKLIRDASFNKICEMIKWKTKLHGKYYYQVNTYYPSSKICSHCGNKTEITKELNIRKWICEKCENKNDRDINASINIMFEGLKLHYQN